jgi:lipoprotein-anchoring transpeptidase ErfK/SrfK
VAAAPSRWEFAPWGLVKSKKAPPKNDWKGDGSFWKGDGIKGSPRIHIKIEEQMAYFYKGDMLVGASPVCTGSDEFPTPRGNFSVKEKDEDHLSSIYGDYIDADKNIVQTQIDNRKDPRPPGTKFDGAKMHWFLRVNGAVGMHEGYLPGYADSHGCIRLPAHMAPVFYKNAPLGTPVKITD